MSINNIDSADRLTDKPADKPRGRSHLAFSIAAVVCAGCIAAATLTGCSGSSDSSSSASTSADGTTSTSSIGATAYTMSSSMLDGQIALTVDNTIVLEDDLTAYIQSQREQAGLSDDSAWASYLADAGQTGSSIRDSALSNYIDTILLNDAIDAEGITITDEEVQEHLEQLQNYYNGYGDDGWEQVRTMQGYDSDEAYAEHLRQSMLLSKLRSKVTDNITVTDDELQAYLDEHADEYAGKKAAFIIMPTLEDAQAVKDLIDNGWLTFQEAALTYSLASNNAYTQKYAAATSSSNADTQTISGSDGTELPAVATTQEDAQAALDAVKALYVGDDAWQDALDSAGSLRWVTETDIADSTTSSSMGGVAYAMLADMQPGDVSDPVQTAMGAQILYCSESYDPETDGAQFSDLPSDLQEEVREAALTEKQQDAWNDYMASLYSNASIDEAAMPAGLPYDVEVPVRSATADESASSSSAASSADDADGEVRVIRAGSATNVCVSSSMADSDSDAAGSSQADEDQDAEIAAVLNKGLSTNRD